MSGFRLSSPNPFWFEDLVFFVIDEGRRLPDRAAAAFARFHRVAQAAAEGLLLDPLAALRPYLPARPAAPVEAPAAALPEAELLDEPLAWALATEPLVTTTTGAGKAIALHEQAREQLGAITYVLDRMRDELAPTLALVRLDGMSGLRPEEAAVRLETSIEALLALSRRNAATRPKHRVLSAA